MLGAGGHGKVCAEIASLMGYAEIIFFDDNPAADTCLGYPVAGDRKAFFKVEHSDCFIAIGSNATRKRIAEQVLRTTGHSLVTLVHPSATVSAHASLSEGTVVMAGAVINPGAVIGRGCIINTAASVDHDCEIDDWCHISVGAHLAGTVKLAPLAFIGAGATVINNIKIATEAVTIGAGALVIRDITERGTYIGIPARRIYAMNEIIRGGVDADFCHLLCEVAA